MEDMATKKAGPWPDVARLNNPDHRKRLERVEDAMAARMPGSAVPRSSVLAWVVERGLEAVEAELGIVKPKKGKG
jgi:hypothetical protein